MGHEEGGVTSRPADSNLVGPKHDRRHHNPLGMVIFASLHERFTDVEMFPLDQAIRLRIVGGNLDVVNTIFLCQIPCSGNKSRTIIHDNFSHPTPPTKNLLKDKIPKSFLSFPLERPPFRPRRQSTAGLNKVTELINHWHKHSVDVNFLEKRGNVRDDRGNMKASELSGLAGMTGRNKPLDILHQHRPPKMLMKVGEGRKQGFMAHSLMSPREDGKASILGDDDLVPRLDVAAHESAIQNKELGSILHKLLKLGLQKINRGQGFRQDGLDDFELVICKLGLL